MKTVYPKLKMRPNATVISWFGLKSLRSLNAGAYPTADQNFSLLTSLTSYYQKPLKIRKNGFEIRVQDDQRQVTSIFKGNPRQKIGKSNFRSLIKWLEVSIYFASHAFILHHWSIFPPLRWNCAHSLTLYEEKWCRTCSGIMQGRI